MNALKSLSIKFKILLIPLAAAIGFATYVVFNLLSMNDIEDSLSHAYKVDYQLLQTAEFALVRLDKIKENLGNAATLGETELLDTAKNLAQEFTNKLSQAKALDKAAAKELTSLQSSFDVYFLEALTLSTEMVSGTVDFATLGERSKHMSDSLSIINNGLQEFQQQRYQTFTAAFKNVSNQADAMNGFGITVGVITIVILFIVAVPIARSIHKSLAEVIHSMREIAQENGDLTVRLTTNSQDEIGDLVYWFNSFIEKLQGVIKDVVDTSAPVATTSSDIQVLSEKTLNSFKRQSSSVEQSKLSVEEMSQSVVEISRNAADAADAAQVASNEAQAGKQVVDDTVKGIQQLAQTVNDSAESINQLQQDTNEVNVVLDVIRGVAEQTNLLALNAAIEAARAGEHGRGFAVVADEVRNLASRTQQSTEEINQMLEHLKQAAIDAVEKMDSSRVSVEASVAHANKAGESLVTINESIKTISDMNGAIAVATEEQTQVSQLMVGHVDDIQACAEDAMQASNEIAGVSDKLAGLATELDSVAKQFNV